jgi:hypothetical protein
VIAHVEVRLRRSLAAVYRFYDAFLFPIDELTPPIASPLDVSIPALDWKALPVPDDATYRFSAMTLGMPPPSGIDLEVAVAARDGDYVSLEQILLSLPLAVATPPRRSDYLIVRPLWPTVALRPPAGETAVRGILRSVSAQPVSGIKVEMWLGGGATPPPGTPYTRTDDSGEFLARFPKVKGRSASPLAAGIRLDDGAIPIVPAAPTLRLGSTQIVAFQRP